jgi:hypothetical protein
VSESNTKRCHVGSSLLHWRWHATKLIALACSKPPKGRARWTLRLLENKVVELGIVERASDSTIHRTLKKTVSNRIGGSAG